MKDSIVRHSGHHTTSLTTHVLNRNCQMNSEKVVSCCQMNRRCIYLWDQQLIYSIYWAYKSSNFKNLVGMPTYSCYSYTLIAHLSDQTKVSWSFPSNRRCPGINWSTGCLTHSYLYLLLEQIVLEPTRGRYPKSLFYLTSWLHTPMQNCSRP